MEKYLVMLVIVLLFSCEDEKKKASETKDLNDQTAETIPPGDIQEEKDGLKIDSEEPKTLTVVDGRYRKIVKDQAAADCNCNCIEISFDEPTEWCIVKDKVYINARIERTGENSADLYLVGPSRDENADRQLPWKDFDTNTPIASIAFQSDGSADLDWKGFSINGEIATDYAIYGKKTLEGKYKKE